MSKRSSPLLPAVLIAAGVACVTHASLEQALTQVGTVDAISKYWFCNLKEGVDGVSISQTRPDAVHGLNGSTRILTMS
eukprot:2763353-Amphidinium_carterae.2